MLLIKNNVASCAAKVTKEGQKFITTSGHLILTTLILNCLNVTMRKF